MLTSGIPQTGQQQFETFCRWLTQAGYELHRVDGATHYEKMNGEVRFERWRIVNESLTVRMVVIFEGFGFSTYFEHGGKNADDIAFLKERMGDDG